MRFAARLRWWVRLALGLAVAAAGILLLLWAWELHSGPDCPPGPGECVLGPGVAAPTAVAGLLLMITAAGLLLTTWLRRDDRR